MSEYIVRETGYPGAVKQEIVGELVRCKDCKYWRVDDCKNDKHGYCPISENDFCSRGEREDDAVK